MRKIALFLRGILIGVALVLPGLSGSLMAVLLGMYEELVDRIGAWRRNLPYLITVAAGAGIGVLLSARLVLRICVLWPLQSNLFFLGLVLGGIPRLLRDARQHPLRSERPGCARSGCERPDCARQNPPERTGCVGCIQAGAALLAPVLSFAAVLALSLLGNADGSFAATVSRIGTASDACRVTGAGLISCMLMMLPGVSGSVILILLGQYGIVYGAVSALCTFRPGAGAAFWICLLFACGAACGVWLASRVLSALMKRHGGAVTRCIAGFTCGTAAALAWLTLRLVQTEYTAFFPESDRLTCALQWLASGGALLLGFLATWQTGREKARFTQKSS